MSGTINPSFVNKSDVSIWANPSTDDKKNKPKESFSANGNIYNGGLYDTTNGGMYCVGLNTKANILDVVTINASGRLGVPNKLENEKTAEEKATGVTKSPYHTFDGGTIGAYYSKDGQPLAGINFGYIQKPFTINLMPPLAFNALAKSETELGFNLFAGNDAYGRIHLNLTRPETKDNSSYALTGLYDYQFKIDDKQSVRFSHGITNAQWKLDGAIDGNKISQNTVGGLVDYVYDKAFGTDLMINPTVGLKKSWAYQSKDSAMFSKGTEYSMDLRLKYPFAFKDSAWTVAPMVFGGITYKDYTLRDNKDYFTKQTEWMVGTGAKAYYKDVTVSVLGGYKKAFGKESAPYTDILSGTTTYPVTENEPKGSWWTAFSVEKKFSF